MKKIKRGAAEWTGAEKTKSKAVPQKRKPKELSPEGRERMELRYRFLEFVSENYNILMKVVNGEELNAMEQYTVDHDEVLPIFIQTAKSGEKYMKDLQKQLLLPTIERNSDIIGELIHGRQLSIIQQARIESNKVLADYIKGVEEIREKRAQDPVGTAQDCRKWEDAILLNARRRKPLGAKIDSPDRSRPSYLKRK